MLLLYIFIEDWGRAFKLLKFGGDWAELWSETCLFRQSQPKHSKHGKEIKQTWAGLENFDIYF